MTKNLTYIIPIQAEENTLRFQQRVIWWQSIDKDSNDSNEFDINNVQQKPKEESSRRNLIKKK